MGGREKAIYASAWAPGSPIPMDSWSANAWKTGKVDLSKSMKS